MVKGHVSDAEYVDKFNYAREVSVLRIFTPRILCAVSSCNQTILVRKAFHNLHEHFTNQMSSCSKRAHDLSVLCAKAKF